MELNSQTEYQQKNPENRKYKIKWTVNEFEKYVEGLKLFGQVWEKIASHIGTKDTT